MGRKYSGYNRYGNQYSTAGGSNRRVGSSYHYSNNNGSYYYKNDNGSRYYQDSYGNSTYSRPYYHNSSGYRKSYLDYY